MTLPSRRPRSLRVLGLLAAGLASAVVLTACGGGDDADDRPDSDSKAAAASSKEAEDPDLASGLLAADAFGPDAVVTSVSPEQLEQGAGLAAQYGSDVQITPEDCAGAVQETQPDLADFDDVAAVSAQVGTSVTVEMLVRGGPIEGTIDDLAGAVERCPEAQISSPQIGQAAVRFENLPVPDLGDGSAALRYTTTIAAPDGSQVSVPALLGGVEDGDRLIILTALAVDPSGAGAPPDPAAFAALLEQAYETQADALD